MTRKTLYGNDTIGSFLSNWRTRIVFNEIRGELLDISCGDNQLVKEYKKAGNHGVGIDIEDYGADIVLDNLNSIPLQSNSVDTVTILASLNYFSDAEKTMKEICRVLRPSGQLIFTMSNKSIMNIWHRFRDKEVEVFAYDDSEIDALMRHCSFKVIRRKRFMFGVNKLYIAVPN